MSGSVSGWLTRRRLLTTAGVLLFLLVVTFAWQAVRAGMALGDVRSTAQRITVDLNDGDLDAVDADVATLRRQTHRAAGETDGPLWSIGAHLPFVGHSIDAVRTTGQVLDRIADRSLPALIGLAHSVADGDLRPRHGRVDIAAVRAHAPAVRRAAAAVDPLADQLADIRTHGLVYPLDRLLPDLQTRVAEAKSAIDATADAFDVLPTMLGADGPRRYLLIVQNPAELRSTGGLPGSLAVLTANHGRVTMGEQGDAGLFGTGPVPVKPTKTEKALYGADLGKDFRDLTFNPDFSRVAQMAAGIARAAGQRVDGVFAVDPIALSYVLAGTGPVDIGNGASLTSANAAQFLLNTVYQSVPDASAQNDFYALAARKTFNALVSGQGDQVRAIRGLVLAAGQHRVLAWSAHPNVAAVIGRNRLSGALPGDTGSIPQVGIYYNDGVAGKIDFYLRQRTTARSLGCTDGVQRIQVTTTLRSTVPKDHRSLSWFITGTGAYAPKGDIVAQMSLYSPWQGHIEKISVDGHDATTTSGRQFGQEVGSVAVHLRPGASMTVTSTMTTGKGQTGNIKVTSTPGMELTPDPATFTTTCG